MEKQNSQQNFDLEAEIDENYAFYESDTQGVFMEQKSNVFLKILIVLEITKPLYYRILEFCL
jgi:hypothetical protein